MLTRRILLATVLLPIATARADATADATTFVTQLAKELAAIVNGPGGATDKQAALAKIVDIEVDVAGVARFCLGRFWRLASPEQQREFVTLFRQMLIHNITGRVGEYAGVTLVVGKAQASDGDVAVSSVVTRPNNAPNQVDWIVAVVDGAPKVVDVKAEGTSLRLTQRSDYAAFLARNNNNVQALIDAIRKQADAPR